MRRFSSSCSRNTPLRLPGAVSGRLVTGCSPSRGHSVPPSLTVFRDLSSTICLFLWDTPGVTGPPPTVACAVSAQRKYSGGWQYGTHLGYFCWINAVGQPFNYPDTRFFSRLVGKSIHFWGAVQMNKPCPLKWVPPQIAQSLDWTIRNLNTALLLRCPAWDTPRGASTPTPSPCPDPNRGHRPPRWWPPHRSSGALWQRSAPYRTCRFPGVFMPDHQQIETPLIAHGITVVGEEGPAYGPLDLEIPDKKLVFLSGRGAPAAPPSPSPFRVACAPPRAPWRCLATPR